MICQDWLGTNNVFIKQAFGKPMCYKTAKKERGFACTMDKRMGSVDASVHAHWLERLHRLQEKKNPTALFCGEH